ncbi:MAG: Ig-like domain-containing protein [Acidobacteriaceae bacterium]
MKKLIFFLILLTAPLRASVNFVQAPGACVSSTVSTSFTCTFNKPVAAGDTLILGTMPLLTPGASAFGVSVSDTVNGNWTPGVLCYSAYEAQASLFYVANTAAGSDTVTVTYAGLFNPVELYISLAEYSGVDTSSPFDVAPTCSSFEDSTSFTGPGLTTTDAADMLISILEIGNGGNTSITSPYTLRVPTDVAIADTTSGNAGPQQGPTWSTQYNNDGFVIDAALRAAGTAGSPTIAAISGSGQSAVVGSNFANPLVVLVKDANGNPVSGTTVTFAGSGVSFPSGATAITGSNGEAQVTARPTTAGAHTVTATVAGISPSANFSETGTPAGGTSSPIAFVQAPASCVSQSAATSLTCTFAKPVTAGDTLILTTMPLLSPGTAPFGVSASDTVNGKWTPGVLCYTANDAQASFLYVVNTAAGSDTVTVTYTSMYQSADLYMSLAEYSGVNHSSPFDVAPACSAFEPSQPFTGPTLTTTQTTDLLISALAAGNGGTTSVSSPYTLRVPNDLAIADDAPGTTGSQTGPTWSTQDNQSGFVIDAALRSDTAGAPSIAAVSGSGQSTAVGSSFANPLVVIVKDANSNPVSGATVTFAGTGVSFPAGATATTGSNGEAQVTAEPTATGALTVTATVAGVSTPATFTETGTAATTASIASYSGSGQSASVGNDFPNPLVAIVKDASNNPVSGVVVTFSGTGVSFPAGATAVTGSKGEAGVTAQPTVAGSLTITASAAGVSTSAQFYETGTAATAASFTLGANPTMLTVLPGQSGTVTLTVTPVNGLNRQISFACSGLPSGEACTFTPSTVTLDGASSASTTMAISGVTTASRGSPSSSDKHGPGWPFTGGGLTLALGCLFFRKRKRLPALFSVALFLCISGISLGCGGSTPSTGGNSLQTSTVTVTATAAAASGDPAIVQTATVTVTE